MTEQDYEINEVVNSIAEDIGRTPTQVVLNWELQQPGIVSPVLGVRSMTHLDEQLHALEFRLNSDQLEALNTAAHCDLGFPLDFIGTTYDTCPWVNWRAPPP